jgi:uncharacterized protein DUF955
MPEGISGVACQLQAGDAILINRQENEGRRNFDLAHEIFHVLILAARSSCRAYSLTITGKCGRRTLTFTIGSKPQQGTFG